MIIKLVGNMLCNLLGTAFAPIKLTIITANLTRMPFIVAELATAAYRSSLIRGDPIYRTQMPRDHLKRGASMLWTCWARCAAQLLVASNQRELLVIPSLCIFIDYIKDKLANNPAMPSAPAALMPIAPDAALPTTCAVTKTPLLQSPGAWLVA